tara:strand:- start:911 stop:1150 length:240 start_codon:yes stop_codon:yes gene_type:complete
MNEKTLKEAFDRVKNLNNESLINFLMQRQDRVADGKSELCNLAIEEFKARKAKEFKILWSGGTFKDEPIEEILERKGVS